jgi:S-adenosylmethionine decarboxylase
MAVFSTKFDDSHVRGTSCASEVDSSVDSSLLTSEDNGMESDSSSDEVRTRNARLAAPQEVGSELGEEDGDEVRDLTSKVKKQLELAKAGNDADDLSTEDDQYVPGTFEGPEKNLCVEFKPGFGHEQGCRALDRAALDAVCTAAKCTILSSISNGFFDAYVLSESSLFVFKHKVIMKTCGTTTLLRCLMPLLKLTDALGLEVDWVGYSRKNFSFPEAQCFPHSSFNEEFEYLKRHPRLEQRVNGEGYLLGPITKDHWLAYICDRTLDSQFISEDVTLNIMMFDLDEKVAALFYKENVATSAEMTRISGICNLVPGNTIDDHAFTPCGYSMNSMLHDAYSTIHITPEKACSYASFETNAKLMSYTSLIKNVINVFQPGRVVITMIADNAGMKKVTDSPFDHVNFLVSPPASAAPRGANGGGTNCRVYSRSSSSCTKVAGDVTVAMGNWELNETTRSTVSRQRTISF